jgi:nucleoside permease NupC
MNPMDKEEVKKLIDKSIEIAMDKHNRNATIISAILGFLCLAAFVDGLFRILGKIPPFLGLDVNIIPTLLGQ